jgi:2-oxoglutarate ferredoxin oxidoreductase subunit alpha
MRARSVSVVIAGSGGAGAITAGTLLLEAAGQAGLYAYMTRSSGAQIRGGEAVAMVRIAGEPIVSHEDHFHLLVGIDWENMGKFAAEMPLAPESLIIGDPEEGEVPAEIAASGARRIEVPLKKIAKAVRLGRPNMVALGIIAALLELPTEAFSAVLARALGRKGEEVVAASIAAVKAGTESVADVARIGALAPRRGDAMARWNISGNEAAGYGAIRGGVRFVAAYPITPATEILEWMAPALEKVGGVLVQAEDELASVNQIIGASFGGTPALTATSGPGLSLMTESIGLAVSSETPIVVINVMRGGPSTGIPTKSEQSDLNIAVYGLHGDAPHLVLAANSIPDCLNTTQWAVYLAETLQTAAIVLSDQAQGQARAIVDRPRELSLSARRETYTAKANGERYLRYALTESGVSPMAIPGTPGCQYTADGLEHTQAGVPSSQSADHVAQLDKRLHKLTGYDYGERWADIEGEGDVAVLTWGSCTGPAREALRRLHDQGRGARLVSLRLLAPAQPERLAQVMAGVRRVLVVEQSHGAQFVRFLRAHYDLPAEVKTLHRPGPLPIRPIEIYERLVNWS